MGAATPEPSATPIEDDLPTLYRVNDRWALSRQSESFRSVRAQLLVLMLATVAAMAAEHMGGHAMAAVAATLYALTIALGLESARRRAGVHWQAHREAAETVKSLAWQYMVHGGPFHSGVVAPEALFTGLLDRRLRDLLKVGWQDTRPAADLDSVQVTAAMRVVRGRAFDARRDIYLRNRLVEQLIWYRNRAVRAQRACVRWSVVTSALTGLALAAAVLKAFGMFGGWDLTGLLSAAAAAGVAWQEARSHRPLMYAHSLVERDLEILRVTMETRVTEETWAEAVAEVERVVSPQHTHWLARFGR
ncbi:DUF4231 domain-containing protein [Streptomyces sp. CA-249302]|uniref:DUF4231 domain-containing protein n=1 Tax=Streptomyces sp. CA-249302 TaxID=3240058 RepID=UPI003D8BC0AC